MSYEDTETATFEDAKPLPLGYDPVSRIKRLFHFDEDTNRFQIQTQQELDPVLAANAEDRKDAPTNWKGNLHRVASIPVAVWHRLPDEIKHDEKRLRAWLDESDQKPFRTRGGTIS